jgi:putative transposase
MNNIYLHKELQSNTTLRQEHSGVGLKKERLDVLDQIMENESIMQVISPNVLVQNLSQMKKSQLPTQESVLIIKKQIYNDKLIYSKKNIQTQESSKTLVLDSIGTDKDLKPFWNSLTQKLSQNLWLPTETDCVDLDSSSWNGSSKKLLLNSWFSVTVQTNPQIYQETYQMTFSQLLQSLLQKTMESEQLNTENKEQSQKNKKEIQKLMKELTETCEEKKTRHQNNNEYQKRKTKQIMDTEKRLFKNKLKCQKLGIDYTEPELKDNAGKAYKIKVYPDKTQKQILKEWFGVRRWVYNNCLDKINSKTVKPTLSELRKHVINNCNFEEKNQWMLNYEYDLRDEAVRDLLKNIKSNKEKGVSFKLKYISKNFNTQSISVLSKKWNAPNNFYSKIFKPKVLSSSEPLPDNLKYTSRLLKSKTNKYQLCIPRPLDLQSENQAHNNMVFIDPGVRDFLTCFDPSGKVITIGKSDNIRIARLLHWKRKLQSKLSKIKINKKKKSMTRALLRIGEKLKCIIEELHKKACKWLCSEYDNIFIPRLNFHDCKNLNKRSKSVLATYQHCSFLNRLIHKSNEYPGCNVNEVNESFTSKTCTKCGILKMDLGRAKQFNCKNCKISIGRDISASRNILLRYFTKKVKCKFDNEIESVSDSVVGS